MRRTRQALAAMPAARRCNVESRGAGTGRRALGVAASALLLSCAVAGPALAQSGGSAGQAATTPVRADPMPLESLLRQAQAELRRGAGAAAYERLSAQVRWYAGLPEYDYLLGLAALDSGNAPQAVLAFERVLTVEPGHLQARAELAKALLATRETEAARREFEAVASKEIPPEARRVIDGYLALISGAGRDDDTRLHGFAEVGLGWDSNVNLGSASAQWLLGNGIAVIPQASSRERGSATVTAAAGLSWQRPIGGGWELTAGTQAWSRTNPAAHTLDQSSIDLSGGVEYRSPCHALTMLAQLQHLQVDGSAFRNARGALAQWRCELDKRTQVGAYLQHFDMHFPEQDIRDARRDIVGGTFARALEGPREPVLVASAYVGTERPRADVPQLRYRFRGARALLSAEIAVNWRGWAAVSWEARDFAGEEPIFGAVRADRQCEIRLGADRAIGRSWVITPQISYTQNNSNLPSNDFRRTQAQLSARYRF